MIMLGMPRGICLVEMGRRGGGEGRGDRGREEDKMRQRCIYNHPYQTSKAASTLHNSRP